MTDRHDVVIDSRFATMVRSGLDLPALSTWDSKLSRRWRILVPADVQAYVVPSGGTEATVAVTGGRNDPAPFDVGSPRAQGVHLHWAMPDALLTGGHDKASGKLALPVLPDRWAIVRTVQPAGGSVVQAKGWIVDASTNTVCPLETYSGTMPAQPDPTKVLDPLNGAAGGSLMWTASYTASAGRFGFHDPLTDLSGSFEADQAVYTVAGWWSEVSHDPLDAARGPSGLDSQLAALGWVVVHDGDDAVVERDEPVVTQTRMAAGLVAPQDTPATTIVSGDGRAIGSTLDDVALDIALPVERASHVVVGPALPTYATLIHGSVLGVPITAALPPADDRPSTSELGVALGQDIDDVISAFGASVLHLDPAHRKSAETLVAAFTSGLIEQLGTVDGLEDLAEREHADGFWALQGTDLAAAKPDRLRAEDSSPMGPLTVGRKGRAGQPSTLDTKLEWGGHLKISGKLVRRSSTVDTPAPPTPNPGAAKQIDRPAPRFFRPQPPMLALRGAHPNHRHHGDGLFDDQGKLRCRFPKECVTEITGVVTGAAVLPSLGSGAIPAEVLTVVREAVLLNPYGYRWFSPPGPKTNRIAAEMVRLYGADGRYDGSAPLWTDAPAITRRHLDVTLAEHSLVAGTVPSPVALTTWRQPWVPLWLEWRVTVTGHDSVQGWDLDGLDLQPSVHIGGSPVAMTLTGRSILGSGVSKSLQEGIRRWIDAERQRDATGNSTLPTTDQDDLLRLGDLMVPLDVMSASLDGIREQLLGIPYVGVIERTAGGKPQSTLDPIPLFGGEVRLEALRIVDAFGRLLEVPGEILDATSTTGDLEIAGEARAMRLRPRIQHLSRWLFRLVDPGQPAVTDPDALHEAFVDQLDPASAVNPVAGFLLPDHIDEELETFTVSGDPIGAIRNDDVTGAVGWEPAPGRPVPPDAGPLAELDAHSRITAEIAAGIVRADAAARNTGTPPASSALTAMLRAIDTTLWTVDTFAAVGSPTVAGLIGRPIAVVRASLRLDAPDDLDEVDVTAPSGVDGRRARFAAMAQETFTVKLGTVTRTDDSLLGFYVDDDYTKLHLVDRVVAAFALASGKHKGHLGLLGTVTTPPVDPLSHPYLVPDGTVGVRIGQTVKLTLLMLPIGRVHLSSGILPRKQLALADDWVTPGLRKLVPSVRVGPVLVDPAEIRLPLVNLLGDKQTFTRRTGPLSWKHDPIVAATQTAYLPRTPHEAQEGWVRVSERDS